MVLVTLGPMICPQPAAIASLIDGRLSPGELVHIEQHLDACSRCAELVAVAASSRGAGTVPVEWGVGRPIMPRGKVLGRYQVRRWLGRGGMGDVYEGFDPKLERPVAIKVLRHGDGQRDDGIAAPARLEREARTLARLSHPHVVAALDIGVCDEQVFLVMELVEGPTLAGWCKAAPRTWREILAAYLEAGEGLAAAHDVGIVHRDFKPQNVLMGADGKARVSDFGLARRFAEEADRSRSAKSDAASEGAPGGEGVSRLLATDQVAGTPRYMAPEQFARGLVDARTDQFSFALAVYEALYELHPFIDTRGLPVDMPSRFREAPASGKSGGKSGGKAGPHSIPPPVRAILRRGLAVDPGARFPSLRALLVELRQAALPATAGRRRLLLAAGAAAVLIGGAFALSVWRGRRVEASLVELAGAPANWTSAPVLLQVPDEIQCLSPLSEETVRVVWGRPRRVEDVNVATGARRAADLLPETYLHGCPQLSPDGRQLIYEGYDAQDRPHIFYAANRTGQGAQPIVPSVEPMFDSHPVWLRSGRAFVFELGFQHPAVFSLATKTFTIIADGERSAESPWGFFKAVSRTDDLIAVIQSPKAGQESWVNIYRWPTLAMENRFRTRRGFGRWRFGLDPTRLYTQTLGRTNPSVLFDARLGVAKYVAQISDRDIVETLQLTEKTMLIAGKWASTDVRYHDERGRDRMVPRPTMTFYSSATLLGNGTILVSEIIGDQSRVLLFNPKDATLRPLTEGPWDYGVSALPAVGESAWLMMRGNAPGTAARGIFRCALRENGVPSCQHLSDEVPLRWPIASRHGRSYAYSVLAGQATVVRLGLLDGGPPVDLIQGTTNCDVSWSGPRTLWYSRRVGRAFQWTEIDVLSKVETGRTVPGTTGCYYNEIDPNAPDVGAVRIVKKTVADVRVHPL